MGNLTSGIDICLRFICQHTSKQRNIRRTCSLASIFDQLGNDVIYHGIARFRWLFPVVSFRCFSLNLPISISAR